MDKDEAIIAVAFIALVGVLIYNANMTARSTANSMSDMASSEDLAATNDNVASFIEGPSIYIANLPFYLQAPVGNVIPLQSASNTMAGAQSTNILASSCTDCGG